MSTSRDALDRAIKLTADGSVAEFAKRLDESPQTVFNWRRRGIPPRKVNAVVKACGGVVAAHELRPDLPELFPVPGDNQAAA